MVREEKLSSKQNCAGAGKRKKTEKLALYIDA
jgi:hypothetical protein